MYITTLKCKATMLTVFPPLFSNKYMVTYLLIIIQCSVVMVHSKVLYTM